MAGEVVGMQTLVPAAGQRRAQLQPARSLYRRLGYDEEELLLTKAIPARHKHPTRQRQN